MADYGVEMDPPGIEGLKKRVSPKLFAAGTRYLLERSGQFWRDQNRREAPRFGGALVASQDYSVDPMTPPQYANVGSNAKHARPVNYGTGLLSKAPDSGHRRHFPPPGALQGWALAHGFSDGPGASIWSTAGGKVSGIIGRRGGLRPNEYMKRGLTALKSRISVFVSDAIRAIEDAWRG
jgi:hypothetical protein